jgi:alpha-D-xyloside xylohydrolase
VFRIHGKGERALFSDNWDAKTKNILLNYDNLRYRLLPYIYSLGWKVTSKGYTMMRSLAFDFMEDPNVNSIPDQYMFGPAFLVNPVTEQMYSQGNNSTDVKTRKVYLPLHANWYDFWTGQKFEGGRTIDAPAPIEIIPLYVRAGSIVPVGPYLQYATEKPADPLEIRIYPGADCSFILYEDENDNYNYEKGKYSTISFHWNDARRQLGIDERQGFYPEIPLNRVLQIIVVGKNRGTGIAIVNEPDKTIQYSGEKMLIQL